MTQADLLDQFYCLADERGKGFNPAITFNGKEYRWAGSYPTAHDATSVARQLLNSAQEHGFVP